MLESYLTPLITSYLSKYIKNIKPSDLQLSFWGGDAVLRNLELCPEAIEDALKELVPFNLKSGRVKSLTIHIPWTAIGSEPIKLSLDNIECTVKLKSLRLSEMPSTSVDDSSSGPNPSSSVGATPTSDQSPSTAPGYVQGLLNRIINNIVINVKNLAINIIQEESDLFMSVSVKSLQWCTANDSWTSEYISTDSVQGGNYSLHKICSVDGMTVCLDQIGSAGQVEVYGDPFIQQCSFECRLRNRFEDNVVVENIVDFMVEKLQFSVTEAQFSLFLHLLDWLLAMYYSFKKLKGRDDVRQCVDSNLDVIPTTNDNDDKQEVKEKSPVSPSQSPSATDSEQGWGSWLMSLVDLDTPAPSQQSAATNRPAPPNPSLSMNLIAKTIIIEMKVNQRKHNPVFFTNPTKVSRPVVKICFQGCSSHISRVPSTTLLGVSVGVASINASISGLCPCKVTDKKTRLHSDKGNNIHWHKNHQIHIYTLGESDPAVATNSVLKGTFFQSATDWVNPTPQEWLQRKDYYKGVWFSYEYYDKGPDRIEEICHESIVLGEQGLIASPDVIHRVGYFIDKFVTSLEAVPLFSKDLVVVGDPSAKTHVKFISDPIKIVFTTNQHLLSLEASSFNQHSPSMATTRERVQTVDKGITLPSIIAFCESLELSITMAMYSGNDTPTANQEFSLNAECQKLYVNAHNWPGCKDVTNLKITTACSTGVSIPSLIFTHHILFRGQNQYTDVQYQLCAPRSSMGVDCSQLFNYCTVYLSWTRPPPHPLSCDSRPPSDTLNNDPSQPGLLVQLTDINFKLNSLPSGTSYALSLQNACVSLVNRHHESSLPIFLYPMKTNGFVDLFDVVSTCNSTTTIEDALQLRVVQKSVNGPAGGLAVELKALGCFILLERDTLSLINKTLSGLKNLFEVNTTQHETPVLKGHGAASARPDPEGLSSVDHYSPTTYHHPVESGYNVGPYLPSLPLPLNQHIEEESDNATLSGENGGDLQKRILTILNEIHLNVNINHMVIVSVDKSLSKYWITVEDNDEKETVTAVPFQCMIDILINERLLYMVLPAIDVRTNETDFYRSFAASMLPGASSWQATLTNGTIYTSEGRGNQADYILHPLNVELSVAPVIAASSTVKGEVSGYGVHVDVNLLHVSFSNQKVSLLRDQWMCVVNNIVQPLSTSGHRHLESVPSIKHPVHSPSVLSSPHLSQSLQYNPTTTASDSTYSISSTSRNQQPSLWLQCTLTKFTIDLASSSHGTPQCIDCHWFVYESDDLSFSLDKQDKYLNFQFKVSTFEGHYKESPTKNQRNLFSKLFSSKCTVFDEDVLLKIESMNREIGSPRSPTIDNQPPLHGLTSHTSFIVFDLKRYSDPHKPLMVKLHVKMFEGVVTIALMKTILELTEAASVISNGQASVSHGTTCSNCGWPQFDIGLECFRVFLPCLPPSTAGVLLDMEGVTVKSDLSYPITRMEVNDTAFRRLSIMVAEKRLPPLPGYEVQLMNIQLIGLNVDQKSGDMKNRVISVFPILSIASSQIQYSPSIQWVLVSSTTSQPEKVYATGDVIELCVKSAVQLSLGISQIATVFKLSRDFTILQNSQSKFHSIDSKKEQTDSHYSVTPFHVLVTTSKLQINYYQGSSSAIQLTVLDPVAKMKRTDCMLSLDCSILRMESMYRNELNEYVLLQKCIGAAQDSHNLLTVNLHGHYISDQLTNVAVSVELGVSVCVTVTPQLLVLLNTVYTDVSMTVSSINPATTSSSRHHEGTNLLSTHQGGHKLWSGFKMTLKTKQLVVELFGKNTCPDGDTRCNCCLEYIKLGCNELHMVLPYVHAATSDWLPRQRTPGTLSFSVCCTGLEVSCSNHTTTCNKYMTSFLIQPTSFKCMVIQTSTISSANHTVLSFVFDPVHLSVGVCMVELVMSVLQAYVSFTEDLMGSNNDTCTYPTATRATAAHATAIDNKIEFQDDLRQKDMIFNTANTQERSFPNSSEIRFFEGDAINPPYMIWKYCEPRFVNRIHVLPVPLGVLADHEELGEGGYPHDMTVHCEISYYNEVNDSFVCVGDLHLSETSVALWDYSNDNGDSCHHSNVSCVHASVWCLTMVGLKWSDDEGVIRAIFPLFDTPSSTILSPLTLAGCTCVDSIIDHQFLPYLGVEMELNKMTLSLVHQPPWEGYDHRGGGGNTQYYHEYTVHSDHSWYPLNLIEFGINSLKGSWCLGAAGHQTIEVNATISMTVQDLKDLSLREVVHPTQLSASVAIKQEMSSRDITVKTSMEPCLIRISPTLVHTVTMATHATVNHMLSHDVNGDDPRSSVLFAAYIVCNMTTENLFMGQDSTIEWLALPRGSSIGYSWNTRTSDKQRLRLALAEDEKEQWTWSSPFVLDEDRGLQEVAIGSPGQEQVYLYIEINKHGGTQKQVIISGLWSIYSLMPHPLLVGLKSTNNPVEDMNHELLEDSRSISFIVRNQESLCIMTCGHDSSVKGRQQSITVVPVDDQVLPLKLCDGSHGDLYFWCNISPRLTSQRFKRYPMKIVMAPCFKVISSLPFSVTMMIASNDVTRAGCNQTVDVHGHGHQTIPCSLSHNVWYLIKMSCLPLGKGVSSERGVASDAFPVSTCIGNQLPVIDNINCGVWPYNTCSNHKPVKVKSKDPSVKTLSLPVDENSDLAVTLHVELQKDNNLGTIVITLSPDVLIVNETLMDLCLLTGIDFNNEIVMDRSKFNVTAIVKRTEEFRIRLSLDSATSGVLSSSPLSLNAISLPKDNRKAIKRVKLHNDQFGCEVVVELSFHKSSLIATLKPSHVIINNTDYPLTVWPILRSLRETAQYDSSHGSVIQVNSSDSQVLGVWSLTGSEGEQLFHMIQVTSHSGRGSWSIPLLLNFVRHSFSLPVSITTPNATPINMVACLLTTHEVDGIKYLVIGPDPFPRLVIENSSSDILEIREAHTHWVHSHSQIIYPGSHSVYEPPSLAMQYPLIKEWVESESDEHPIAQAVQFKQLSDIAIQIGIRSCDNHVTWSDSFSIPHNHVQSVPIDEESMNVTTITNGVKRTTVVAITPSHSPDQPLQDNISDESIDTTMSVDLSLSQIVLTLDTEAPNTVRPLLIITSDSTHVTISHAPTLSQGILTIGSVQVDTFVDPQGEVCVCPRHDHEPPPSLLKPHPQSFVCVEVELVTRQNVFSKVNVCVQPLTVRADDVMILKIVKGVSSCIPPPLVVSGKTLPTTDHHLVKLKPVEVIAESARDKLPLSINQLTIGPVKVYLTAHMSRILCLSCDDAFLGFSDIVLINAHTNTTELSQFLSLHYITGLVMQLGWVLGSLDIVGSPSSLLYRLQNGLYNFLYLPYEGLTRGPGFFVVGVGRGLSSLVANATGGLLKTVTNFSTSVASNMEYLSLDPDHASYQVALRQGSKGGLGASLLSGVSSFGMSLMSAVAGVVDQPMQVMHQAETATAVTSSDDARSFTQQMTAGVGKGLLGLVTKPIGGAFQLVSQTGQGILNSSGLSHEPCVKHGTLHQQCLSVLNRKDFRGSTNKYMRLLKGKHYSSNSSPDDVALSSACSVIFHGYATINLPSGSSYECLVLMDYEKLYVFDIVTDSILACLRLVDYQCDVEEVSVTEQDMCEDKLKSQSNDNPISDIKVHVEDAKTCVSNKENTEEETLHDSLPHLGGNQVVLSLVHTIRHQRLSSSVSSYESYSAIERYLNEVDDIKSSHVEVLPQRGGQQYTIIFIDNHAHLFESVFNHNIHISHTN